MIILKFGGTSIGKIENIIDIIKKKIKNNNVICVFSALNKTTDKLSKISSYAINNIEEANNIISDLENEHITLVNKLKNKDKVEKVIKKYIDEIKQLCIGINYLNEYTDKVKAKILSYGELISSEILYYYISEKILDYKIAKIDSRKVIKTENSYLIGSLLLEKTEELVIKEMKFNKANLYVVPGYIASDIYNNTTTLGRGGSDYTAAIYGYIMNAKKVEIWTDVDGIRSSDPNKVKNTQKINLLNYSEMSCMSYYGANVIYTPTIYLLFKKNIQIYINNTLEPNNKGTVIETIKKNCNNLITAVTKLENIAVIKISGIFLIGNIGFSSSLFSLFSDNNINIIMTTQSPSEYLIYIAINILDLEKIKKLLDIKYNKTTDIIVEYHDKKSIVTIIGRDIYRIVKETYTFLEKNKVNVLTQTITDGNISLIVSNNLTDYLIESLHNIFFNNKFQIENNKLI